MEVADEYHSNIYVYIENNSQEPLSVNIENIVINGWALPTSAGYCTLMPGTNAVDMIDIGKVVQLGITSADDIQNVYYSLNIYNSETYATYFEYNNLKYFPGDPSFIQDVATDGEILYEDNAVLLMLIKEEESDSYVSFHFYIQSKTSDSIYVSVDDVIVNGKETYDSMYSSLPGYSQCIKHFSVWYDAEANFESYDDLETLTFTLTVHEASYNELVNVTVELVAD